MTPDQIGRMLADLQRRMDRIENSPRLSHAALDNTNLVVKDGAGTVRGRVGMQEDGTVGLIAVDGPAPGIPSAPVVTSSIGGLRVVWDGTLADGSPLPADFDHVAVHVATTSDFTPSAATFVGTITKAGDGGMLPVIPLPYQAHYVRLTAVNTSGAASDPSAETAATPTQVEGPDLKAGSVTAATIEAGAVTAEKLEAILQLATRLVAGDPAASRVELNENGLRVYNGTGELVIRFDSADGSAVFTGTITGSTMTGGLIQTASSGERITLNEGGNNKLFLYNATGQITTALTPLGASMTGPEGNVIAISPAVELSGSTTTYPAIRWTNAAQTKVAKILAPSVASGELNLTLETSSGTALLLGEGFADFVNSRLLARPPASTNSALYVEANTAHTGNLLRLFRDTDKFVVDKDGNATVAGRVKPMTGESGNLTLQSGWTAFDSTNYGVPQVRKTANGMAYLVGRLSAGTATNGTLVATLPNSSYWPVVRHPFPHRAAQGGVDVTLLVSETGELRIYDISGTVTNLSLAGISWPLW